MQYTDNDALEDFRFLKAFDKNPDMYRITKDKKRAIPVQTEERKRHTQLPLLTSGPCVSYGGIIIDRTDTDEPNSKIIKLLHRVREKLQNRTCLPKKSKSLAGRKQRPYFYVQRPFLNTLIFRQPDGNLTSFDRPMCKHCQNEDIGLFEMTEMGVVCTECGTMCQIIQFFAEGLRNFEDPTQDTQVYTRQSALNVYKHSAHFAKYMFCSQAKGPLPQHTRSIYELLHKTIVVDLQLSPAQITRKLIKSLLAGMNAIKFYIYIDYFIRELTGTVRAQLSSIQMSQMVNDHMVFVDAYTKFINRKTNVVSESFQIKCFCMRRGYKEIAESYSDFVNTDTRAKRYKLWYLLQSRVNWSD